MQLVIVTLCLLAACGYAAYRLRRAATDPCAGCSGCELKRRSRGRQKRNCPNAEKEGLKGEEKKAVNKKSLEKFGRSE